MKFTKYEQYGAYHWKQYDQGTKYKVHADRIKNWVTESTVLDIGAGDGKITSLLGAIGVDNELEGVRLAREKGVDVRLGDAYYLPFPDGSFQSALMADVLEHLQFPEKGLREARRVITDYLYITTPPKDITPGKLLDSFHYQEWSPEGLKEVVEKEGFVLEGEVLVVPEEKNMYAKFKKVDQPSLSILIPARNEEFLEQTVIDILANKRGKTEIIVGLDGQWPHQGLAQHPDLIVYYSPKSIGQRAMTNQLARLSKSKYVMKVDAHCSFDKGFDTKMMSVMQDDWTMVPTMRNLHAFDWVCPNAHRRYQGPSGPCTECGEPTQKEMVWKPRDGTRNYSYCFDAEPHFQYFKEYSKREEGRGDITESMSLQGSCFMCTRDKYWQLDLCDEDFGSWGSQGIEVACKTWLSGGQVKVNHNTWYAHMFRTQGLDFSFPYQMDFKQQEFAKHYAKDLFFNNKWPQQIHPLSWLIEKFWPVPGWTQSDLDSLSEESAN